MNFGSNTSSPRQSLQKRRKLRSELITPRVRDGPAPLRAMAAFNLTTFVRAFGNIVVRNSGFAQSIVHDCFRRVNAKYLGF